jgi:hypothetical protein
MNGPQYAVRKKWTFSRQTTGKVFLCPNHDDHR